jgi:hypothetical protein
LAVNGVISTGRERMAINFDDIEDALAYLNSEIASIRGEALAAQLIATYAIVEIVRNSPGPKAYLLWIHDNVKLAIKNVEENTPGDRDILDIQVARAKQRCEEIFADLPRALGLQSDGSQ